MEVRRFIIGYSDDIIIKVISEQEANYAMLKLNNILKQVGLNINSNKSSIFNLLFKSKFD